MHVVAVGGERIMGNKRLKLALHLLRRAAKLASDLEETIDAALFEATSVERYSSADAGTDLLEIRQDWPSPAEPVSLLTIKLLSDGRSQVSRDDRQPLELPRRLTELLLFATSGPTGVDGVVSFRLVGDAARTLAIRKAYLLTLVLRLRQKLEQHGWNPNLLETNRLKPDSKLRFLTKKLNVIKGF